MEITMLKDNKGGVKPMDVGTSAKVHIPAGSGSRPTTSKVGIETSAPDNPHTLGRAPADFLK